LFISAKICSSLPWMEKAPAIDDRGKLSRADRNVEFSPSALHQLWGELGRTSLSRSAKRLELPQRLDGSLCFGDDLVAEIVERTDGVTGIAACCARAASGRAVATPPSAASNSRRPMVTVIRPSVRGA
jgi:hypothetical protein